MKNKTILIIIVIGAIVAVAMTLVMKKQADEAGKVSDKIMEEFKKVDDGLKRAHDSIENSTRNLTDSLKLSTP